MEFLKISNSTEIVEKLNFFISRDYDKNSMLRIIELYKLRDHVMGYLEEQEGLNPPPENGKVYWNNSIYTTILHSIDVLIYNFMNDESMVVLNGREAIKLTMAVCVKGLSEEKYTFPRHDKVINEISDLYINRNDEIIGSMFLDFTVSLFSALEKFLSDVYYLKAKKEKIAKDKKRYRGNVPAKEKINSVLNLCVDAAVPITRNDKSTFMEAIDVLREMRNTIHTLGIYTKDKDITYTIKGMTVYLRKNKPTRTSDYRFQFMMCMEIIDIYRKICVALNADQVKYIELDI